METVDLVPLIESLEDNIDDLEEALDPILKNALSDTAGKLPLLDKAQLYVLITYAIESTLFCMSSGAKFFVRLIIIAYLRLNEVNSKEHPVFRELTRVKQYFEKINAAESTGARQNATLDKAAAGRFIKHALVSCNRCAWKFADTDFNPRLETRNLRSIWLSRVKIQGQPHIPGSKMVPGNASPETTRKIVHGRSPQVMTATATRSIGNLTVDQARRG